MGSLTSRGRALVVVAFVLSAALCGGAAVALVVASRDDDASPTALPRANPTLISPSQSPTPSPAAASPTPTTATPRPGASPTPSPTATVPSSPAPRATTSPRAVAPRPEPAAGLYSSAEINIASGGTTADVYRVTAHATDGDGTIRLRSLDWGDGSPVRSGDRGAACNPPAKAPADCRDFSWTHSYPASTEKETYTITVILESDEEVSDPLRFTITVDPAP